MGYAHFDTLADHISGYVFTTVSISWLIRHAFMFTINIVIVSIVCLLIHFIKPYCSLLRIPRAPGHFILGDIAGLLTPPFGNRTESIGIAGRKLIETLNRKYWYQEKIFCFWVFWYPFVNINDPELIETVMKTNLDKPAVYRIVKFAIGDGLMNSNKEKWRPRRRKIQPCFSRKKCEAQIPLFNQSAKDFVTSLENDGMTGKPVDIVPRYTKMFLEAICKAAFGIDLERSKEAAEFLSSAVETGNELVLRQELNPLSWNQDILEVIQCKGLRNISQQYQSVVRQIANQMMKRWRRDDDDQSSRHNDDVDSYGLKTPSCLGELLVKMYSESRSDDDALRFTFDDILDEIGIVLAGGFETSSWTLAWATYLLASHQEIQSQVASEIDDVFAGDRERPITLDDLKKMTFLESCLKETLRLFPILPFIARKAGNDLHLDRYVVPKGTSLVIPIFSIHRNPDNYPDPDKFIPERFSPYAPKQIRHPYLFLAFSGGPRDCIGQNFVMLEMKLFLAYILRQFSLHSDLEYEKLSFTVRFQVKPVEPIQITFKRRP